VEELMEISRLDAGREAVEREAVPLRATVETLLRARDWTDRVLVTGEELVLETDRRRLERIVGNLVQNAVEHGDGRAEILIAPAGAEATIAVADRGPGIPPEHLARVFDRFYKADRARSTGGSGLGLAIARENARLLGGDITVESPPEGGARFTVRLDAVAQRLHGGGGAVATADEDDER
jgi:two-component system sensor histidine kinase MtrB